jgi:hypothetical protein
VPHPVVAEDLGDLADGIKLHRTAVAMGEHLTDEPLEGKPTVPGRQPVRRGGGRPTPVGDLHDGRHLGEPAPPRVAAYRRLTAVAFVRHRAPL